MKLYYIVNARMPTEKAHGYQIAKMCSKLAELDVKVNLLVPNKYNVITEDIYNYYGVRKNFKADYIKVYNFIKVKKYFKKYSFIFSAISFFFVLLFKKLEKNSVVFTRNPEIAFLFGLKGHKIIFEAHVWPNSKIGLYKFLLRRADLIVCNSGGTAGAYQENGFKNILVAPNGVDLKEIENAQASDRLTHNLGKEKYLAMYIGHLYKWKGIDVMFDAARKLQNSNIQFVFIGGTDVDIKKYRAIIKKESLDNIVLLGHKQKKHIPGFLKMADCLLLPNAPVSTESIKYTSPIKMFEYMASGRPIIASNLPSIKEVLNDSNSVLFKAGDSESLISALKKVKSEPELAKKITKQALADVQGFTWSKRAEKILSAIKKL